MRRNRWATTALVVGSVLLTGCASAQEGAVGEIAATFDDPSGDPEARCDLLLPTTRAAFEEDMAAPCAEGIADLPVQGGAVESVEVWCSDAQVVLGDDTLFLTETSAGWRVAAAACTPRGDAPYDCEVEGP